jgi:hypothetical protein
MPRTDLSMPHTDLSMPHTVARIALAENSIYKKTYDMQYMKGLGNMYYKYQLHM